MAFLWTIDDTSGGGRKNRTRAVAGRPWPTTDDGTAIGKGARLDAAPYRRRSGARETKAGECGEHVWRYRCVDLDCRAGGIERDR